MRALTARQLLAPTIGTGVLMAVYLLARPYGDAGSDAETAQAFASTAWLVAHVCGALALASVGRLGLRVADLTGSLASRIARFTGLAGAVLVLPYYGAETFALHVIGQHALTDPTLLALAEEVRNQPVAMTTFGIGLLLLSAAGIAFGIAATRGLGLRPRWGAWPLAVAIALFPVQFFMPPTGRLAFGVLYALAAALFAVAVLRAPAEANGDQVPQAATPAPMRPMPAEATPTTSTAPPA